MRFIPATLAVAVVAVGLCTAAVRPATGSARPGPAAARQVSTRTLLAHLTVTPGHDSGYDRAKFPLWTDTDGDGCDTRQEVLIAEATVRPHVGADCTLSGGHWFSPYDAVRTTDPSTFDIDHVVPLAEAWSFGAWQWTTATRTRYANDLGYGSDLAAVSAHSNRSKGDRGPGRWLPPRTSFDCRYISWWVAVKWRWELSLDRSQHDWLYSHLASCGWPTVDATTHPPITRSGGGGTGGGGVATSGVRVVAIQFDPPGSDTPITNASLNAEWVRIRNVTSTARTLTGWSIRDASSHSHTFPALTLPAHGTARIHSGHGARNATNLFWASNSYIWNNTGDTAGLRNAASAVVDTCHYTASQVPLATC